MVGCPVLARESGRFVGGCTVSVHARPVTRKALFCPPLCNRSGHCLGGGAAPTNARLVVCRTVSAFLFLLCFVLVPRVAFAAPAKVHTEPGDLPRLEVAGVPLPLRHTNVDIEVHGFVAHVGIAQTFVNEASEPIEARYAFPLPENAAVRDMNLKIGNRTIRSEILTREEARRGGPHAPGHPRLPV